MKVYLDVTGFIEASYMTGIQRVVREVSVRMLNDKRVTLVLLYCHNRLGDTFSIIDNDKYLEVVDKKKKKQCVTNEKISIYELERGAVFYDVDGVWMISISRSVLLPILKQNGVKIVTHVHDIIVLNNPSYGYQRTIFNFMGFVAAQFIYADVIMTCSKSNIDDFRILAGRLNLRCPKYQVVPCGSDFYIEEKKEGAIDNRAKTIVKNGKYIMMVSTIEPRKNQRILFEAYKDAFKDMGIQLVFVGREGWNVHEFIEEMHAHEDFGKTFHHLSGINDETLDYLYDNAFLIAFTSYNEGFGLPIVEGIKHKKVVIASDAKVLKEVGGDYCDYYEQDNIHDLINTVKKYFENESLYMEKIEKVKKYVPYTWDNATNVIIDTILNCTYIPVKMNEESLLYTRDIHFPVDYRIEAWRKKYEIDYGCYPNIVMRANKDILQISAPEVFLLLRGVENEVTISLIDVGKVEIKCFAVTKDGVGISNIASVNTNETDKKADLLISVDTLENNADLFILYRKSSDIFTSISRVEAIIE